MLVLVMMGTIALMMVGTVLPMTMTRGVEGTSESGRRHGEEDDWG